MNENEENKLVAVIEESGLEKTQSENILSKFRSFFEQAQEWERKAAALVVTDESETEKIAQAREARLALKKIRTEAENTRKELKEDSLRRSRAIDGVNNVIKALIEPIEKHLEKQEKFVENQKKDRIDKMIADRTSRMSQYIEDTSVYNFENMSSEVFEALLSQVKGSWDRAQEEIKKAEEARLEEERKKEEEQEKIRQEHAEMKKKEEDRLKKEEEEKKRLAEEKRKIEEEHQKALEEERKIATEAAEKLRLKEEEEKKRQFEEEKKIKEVQEAERQKKLAPEKDKLFEYSEKIRKIESPEGLSKAGLEVVKKAEERLLAISQDIKLAIKEL